MVEIIANYILTLAVVRLSETGFQTDTNRGLKGREMRNGNN